MTWHIIKSTYKFHVRDLLSICFTRHGIPFLFILSANFLVKGREYLAGWFGFTSFPNDECEHGWDIAWFVARHQILLCPHRYLRHDTIHTKKSTTKKEEGKKCTILVGRHYWQYCNVSQSIPSPSMYPDLYSSPPRCFRQYRCKPIHKITNKHNSQLATRFSHNSITWRFSETVTKSNKLWAVSHNTYHSGILYQVQVRCSNNTGLTNFSRT